MSTVPSHLFTEQEYLARERTAVFKSEFYRGEVFAMAGATREHNLIAANVSRSLGNQLAQQSCEVYQSDMKIRVAATGLHTYPDVVVGCGTLELPDGLLTPSQVRRRRWKRRAIYLAIAGVSAGFVVLIGVRIAIAVMAFWMSGGKGAEPALLASGGAVPDSIVRLARQTGSVQANERIELVFIQAHHTFADALLVTDSAIIRRTPQRTIRRSLEESNINLQPMKRGGSAGGLLIVKRKGAAPDTLYQDLSGREAFLLMNEFVTLQRAQKARDSTSK